VGGTSDDRSGSDHPVVDGSSIQHWDRNRSKWAAVIDCDTQPGKDRAQWRLLGVEVEVVGHRLRRTFSAHTPSGGLHLYFTAPDQPLGNTAGKLGLAIDTRGDGGYVVGPGSVCRNVYYAISDRNPVSHLPGWIVEALTSTMSERQLECSSTKITT